MSHFSFLNLAIGIITFLAWGGLIYIREKYRIKFWFINRFTRDKIPQLPPDDTEGHQTLLPFPYDDFRPKKEKKADTPPIKTEPVVSPVKEKSE